jgi:hypothetical protein
VLVEEAAGGLQIGVEAGRQCDAFGLGEFLRIADQADGRSAARNNGLSGKTRRRVDMMGDASL